MTIIDISSHMYSTNGVSDCISDDILGIGTIVEIKVAALLIVSHMFHLMIILWTMCHSRLWRFIRFVLRIILPLVS